jgi:hypothetical protein
MLIPCWTHTDLGVSCAGHRYVTTAKAPAATAAIPPPIHDNTWRFFGFATINRRDFMPAPDLYVTI